jgi:hypothetical protein
VTAGQVRQELLGRRNSLLQGQKASINGLKIWEVEGDHKVACEVGWPRAHTWLPFTLTGQKRGPTTGRGRPSANAGIALAGGAFACRPGRGKRGGSPLDFFDSSR